MDSRIDAYLEDLRFRMRGKVKRSKQNEILSEARTHLEDETVELIAQGMPREVAEDAAIKRFGDAEQVKEWYLAAHQLPSIWRAAAWPLAILVAYMGFSRYLPFFILPGSLSSMVLYINLTLVLMIWACFKAKRSTLSLTVPAIAIYSVGLFVYFSAFCVPRPGEHGEWIINRATADKHISQAKTDIRKSEAIVTLLQKGHEVFRTAYEPVRVPSEFKTPDGYATPMFFQMRAYPILNVYLNGQRTNGLMTSYSEARQFWVGQPTSFDPITKQQEPHDIAQTRRDIYTNQRVISELPGLLRTTWKDHATLYAGRAAMNAFLPLYFAIAGDLGGSFLRWVRRTWRKRTRRWRYST